MYESFERFFRTKWSLNQALILIAWGAIYEST